MEAGKIHNIIEIMKTHRIDILVLTETHTKEPDKQLIMGYTVWHSADAQRTSTGKLAQNFTGTHHHSPKLTPGITDIRPTMAGSSS